MPKLKTVYELDPDRVPFDFYEVVAALAPRAFFSNSPISDSNFDVAGVRKAIMETTPADVELLSGPSRFNADGTQVGSTFVLLRVQNGAFVLASP